MQRPPIIDSEILERELALSIVKGAAATKAKELFVASRRDLDTDNLVFCLAIRTAELCYLWHESIIAPGCSGEQRPGTSPVGNMPGLSRSKSRKAA